VILTLTRANLGGVAKYVATLAHALIADGNQVLIVTGEVQGAEIEDPVMSSLPIHRIPSMGRSISPFSDVKAFKSFKAIVNDFQPDIIHSHMAKAGFISRFISRSWYRKFGNPVRVHTFHGHSFSEPEFRGLKRKTFLILEKYLAKRAHALVSVGGEIKKELVALGIGNPDLFTNIPPGVEFPKLIQAQIARHKLALNKSVHVVAWIGRMTSVKNPHLVMKIAEKFPETTFVMAGGGDLLDEIKCIAPANVKVLGWSDSAVLLSACDVVLLTSFHEGMPLALIEAQIAGRPVVATNVGSVSEVIVNGETGFVGSQDELIRSLELILGDTHLREEIGNKARVRAAKLFTIERMVDKHRGLYSDLTGNKNI